MKRVVYHPLAAAELIESGWPSGFHQLQIPSAFNSSVALRAQSLFAAGLAGLG